MSKRFSSVSRMIKLACCVVTLGQVLNAADFSVADREAVLQLTAEIQATQFLTHATFGPKQSDVTALAAEIRQKGTIKAASDWIDAQMAVTASLHHALEESMIDNDLSSGAIFLKDTTTTPGTTIYVPQETSPGVPKPPTHEHVLNESKYRQHAWWTNAVLAPDQLRQKTAWTLYQIFAVNEFADNFNSDSLDSTVTGGPTGKSQYQGLTSYYDIFVKNAFGKYREALGRVTYHAIMGNWLSYRGNKKEANGVFPDENYAREVMQLFTIGIFVLNDSGEQEIIAGDETPSYDPDDIRELAQVFTGLGYGGGTIDLNSTAYSPYTSSALTSQNSALKHCVPMRMFGGDHDITEKVLLDPTGSRSLTNRQKLPVRTSAHTESTANVEIDSALNGLVNHVSCPPFIANKFIQRLVKSNPSKGYIQRVVNAFKTGTYTVAGVSKGSGVRGDLTAVVNAVLLDAEAWQPIKVSYIRATGKYAVTTLGSEDSRLQEPVVNYTRFLRFFMSSASFHETAPSSSTYASGTTGLNSRNELRFGSRDADFDQTPYGVPSVFNFFQADYQPPGTILNFVPSARIPNGVLVAPEFQVVNAVTSTTVPNFLRAVVTATNSSVDSRIEGAQTYSATMTSASQADSNAGITFVVDRSKRSIAIFDFAAWRDLCDTPANIDILTERLDKYLCAGTMNTQYRNTLRTIMKSELTRVSAGGLTTDEKLQIAKGAVLAVITAPSFMVTK